MSPADFIQKSAVVFLFALAATLIYLMLVGKIHLRFLLHDQNQHISPSRVQALVATLIGGGGYLMALSTHDNSNSMPPVPAELLAIVGGSHTIYLAGKVRAMLQSISNSNRSIS